MGISRDFASSLDVTEHFQAPIIVYCFRCYVCCTKKEAWPSFRVQASICRRNRHPRLVSMFECLTRQRLLDVKLLFARPPKPLSTICHVSLGSTCVGPNVDGEQDNDATGA